MIRPNAPKTPVNEASTTQHLIIIAASIGLVCGLTGRSVHATPNPVNSDHVGNGTKNRNILYAASPTSNHGYQHTNNSNAGGLNSVLNTLCKRARTCHVTQNLIIKIERPARKGTTSPRQATTAPPTSFPFLYIGPGSGILMGITPP